MAHAAGVESGTSDANVSRTYSLLVKSETDPSGATLFPGAKLIAVQASSAKHLLIAVLNRLSLDGGGDFQLRHNDDLLTDERLAAMPTRAQVTLCQGVH
jgi:hypothetical protein|eukprot:SAG25_NODE_288_length_10343_cov_3.673858_16_plen_99_part_00